MKYLALTNGSFALHPPTGGGLNHVIGLSAVGDGGAANVQLTISFAELMLIASTIESFIHQSQKGQDNAE